jgi:hypothetical protein
MHQALFKVRKVRADLALAVLAGLMDSCWTGEYNAPAASGWPLAGPRPAFACQDGPNKTQQPPMQVIL